MNILVLATAAESGGAKTILLSYYERACLDKANNYYFCIGLLDLKNSSNVIVIPLPWSKKSGFHRLFFDGYYARKLLSRYSIDEVFSLNNTAIPTNLEVEQTIYLHQYIPFSPYSFNLFATPKLWFKKNIVGYFIKKSLKLASRIIVQSEWFKKILSDSNLVEEKRIVVEPPTISVEQLENHFFSFDEKKPINFFYPADSFYYKNHKVLFKAIRILKRNSNFPFKLVLTINSDSSCLRGFDDLMHEIVCLGTINYSDVLRWYSKSVLVFPSFIETFGMPMLEAKIIRAPIVASDTLFSHEILDGYDKAVFFPVFEEEALANCLNEIGLQLLKTIS